MKKVNGFVVSAIAGFSFAWLLTCFVLWKFDPSLMTESQRFNIVWFSIIGLAIGACVWGMIKNEND